MRRAGLVFLVCLLGATALGRAAHAAGGGPRTVAIVEIRSGASQVPDLGERLATMARAETELSVTGPAEARRKIADVDAQVARCAGDPPCLADLGRRLGVQSLMVAAVSQLGDLIVAIQLVDVEARTVSRRLAEPLPPRTVVDDRRLRGWLEGVLPADAFRRFGTLSIRSETTGATVEIDGEVRGVLPLPPLSLAAPAQHTVRISKPGHRAFQVPVSLEPGRTVEVVAPLPVRDQPLWKRPWVWGVAVGALAAGTVVGLRLADDPSSTVDGHASVVRHLRP